MTLPLSPPLSRKVVTPELELRGAAEDLFAQVLPVVRAGVTGARPEPFHEPTWLYENHPLRERKGLQTIWRGPDRVDVLLAGAGRPGAGGGL
ncbi:hypothetical protein LAJ19_14710 (plasmid) [Deinococcus taeanensis]|uniref:hypothetical protein n=1 Tax=Deinococcus taeanensis TaxID=2737050 RepID=UPI001CDD4CCE|nr:hypothetical protein [Deinococcus taeanensis]UBV44414.1 hypothetical protein LAJ19_14710 [Deinococcus taeanensis]